MILTIHRGAREIGGTCIELQSGESRIVLDLGIPLVAADKKERFDSGAFSGMPGEQLVEHGVLPDVKGLYAWDMDSKPIDALLISHAHMDHYGFLKYIRDDLTVCLGNPTQILIDLTRTFTNSEVSVKNPKHFKSGEPFQCGSFRITPYLMDHSAFDAHGFVVESDGKTLIYTGDFRGHGRKQRALDYFLAKAPRQADAILIEGSMLGRESEYTPTESDLEDEIADRMRDTQGIILAHTSSQNIDRIVTLYRACKKSGRQMCIDFYTANVLAELRKSSGTQIPYPSDEYELLRVFYPLHLTNRVVNSENSDYVYRMKKYKITATEIAKGQDRVAMLVRPTMVSDLDRVHRAQSITYGSLIYSLWTGYLDDPYTKRLIDWASTHGLSVCNIHTSGHAHIGTLKNVIDQIAPKKIIPIHTFYPEQYSNLFGENVHMVADGIATEI